MTVNEGRIDRILRVIVGVVILSFTVVGSKTPWALIGLIPLLTGLIGICPLYSLLGIRTCPIRKPK
jgi:hypothetical protein